MGQGLILRKKGGVTLSSPDFLPKRVGKMGRNKSTLNWGVDMGAGEKGKGI